MSAEDAAKLREARALIEDPERWTQGAYARDEHDQPVDIDSPAACRFCAVGAADRVGADMGLLFDASMDVGGYGITVLNDETDHRTVLRMFDRAIELAEAPR